MTDHLGQPSRFVARLAKLTGSYTGASSGVLNPGLLAVEELGDLHWGEVLGYMIRRFGMPNLSSDPYKEICRWVITTPMEGLCLGVEPTPSSTSLLFGYILTSELNEKLYDLKFAKEEAWRNRFAAWAVETYGDVPASWKDNFYEVTPSLEDRRAALNVAREWIDAFRLVDKINTPLTMIDEAEEAIRRTLRDLTRTVGVRDQLLSIHGLRDRPLREVKPSQSAGLAPPPFAYEPDMWKIYGPIHKAGGTPAAIKKVAARLGAKG